MNDGDPHSTLREWRAHMGSSGVLSALLGVSVVLTLAGPFGTDVRLTLLPRAVYWLALVFLTYGTASLVSGWLGPRLTMRHTWLRALIVGLANGAAVAAVVLLANYTVFGWLPLGGELLAFAATVIAIAVVVTIVLATATHDQRQTAPPQTHKPTTPDAPAPPPLLDRLPLDKRGALVSLSVEDHYVRIQTTRGQDLVLLRLSDAIRETGATRGAQVHRSHWAAFDQVASAQRNGDRAVLTMTHGPDIPVSRANLPKLKEAGLLPR